MSSLVVTPSRDDLVRRRQAILQRLGITAERLEVISESRTLTTDEYEAREELDEIAFLLGE